jgi:ABC-type spermidine/putrescine transport system permease subunit II
MTEARSAHATDHSRGSGHTLHVDRLTYSYGSPISLFLADARGPVLPIRLWQMIQADLDPRVASISAVLVALTLVLMLIMERIVGFSRQLTR